MSKKKIGRPTKRTKKLDEELLLWVSEAKTIRSFCREKKIDSATIYSWLGQDALLSQRLAHARDVGALVLEDEIQAIADMPTEHRDDVQHRKLQIYAREKRLVWNNPGRYGSKVQLGGAVGLPPIQLSDVERATRIKQLLEKAGVPQLEVTIEPTQEKTDE
tara:strand:- start:3166 stop:3648 length:483 start_codon:yes stop_codon:yes gene_type:complete